MSVVFAVITMRLLVNSSRDEVHGEHLPVVGMTGELNIDAGGAGFGEVLRLMVEQDDEFAAVEGTEELGEGATALVREIVSANEV